MQTQEHWDSVKPLPRRTTVPLPVPLRRKRRRPAFSGNEFNLRRLALVTDAWHPQTNGVVHTLDRLVRDFESQGIEVLVLSPEAHRSVPMPLDHDYKLAVDPWHAIPRLCDFQPDAVHIATEGPLGWWANRWMVRHGMRFSTSFHTRFPDYVEARFKVPAEWTWSLERLFHKPAVHTLVGTRSLIEELNGRDIGRKLVHWPRGVDAQRFHPAKRRKDLYRDVPGPVWLYVGRVAVEKSIEDFLSLRLPGTKVVVGDGPAREQLQRKFPETVFRGWQRGDELAAHFASADCFVFPSRTETFGNVILEALASGVPVAAVPAPGPVDLIEEGVNGAIDNDLAAACLRAQHCSRARARASTAAYTYSACHTVFRQHLVPVLPRLPHRSASHQGMARAVV